MIRVNIGCGRTPTPGWTNYDNSMSLRLANHPLLTYVLDKCGLLNNEQMDFIHFIQMNTIRKADASKYIPLPDNSVEVLYSSHMVEHLDREEVKSFLSEARRILIKNGIIRIVVPDLRIMVDKYLANGDADEFIKNTGLAHLRPKTLYEKLCYVMIRKSLHRWMYDGPAVVRLLVSAGFRDLRILPAGATMIPDPGELNLSESAGTSVYIEAYNP
jgi:predicted SAM-dependent methyltransferase